VAGHGTHRPREWRENKKPPGAGVPSRGSDEMGHVKHGRRARATRGALRGTWAGLPLSRTLRGRLEKGEAVSRSIKFPAPPGRPGWLLGLGRQKRWDFRSFHVRRPTPPLTSAWGPWLGLRAGQASRRTWSGTRSFARRFAVTLPAAGGSRCRKTLSEFPPFRLISTISDREQTRSPAASRE